MFGNPDIDMTALMNPQWAKWFDIIKANSPDGKIHLGGDLGNAAIGSRGFRNLSQSRTQTATQPTAQQPKARQTTTRQPISTTPKRGTIADADTVYAPPPVKMPPSMSALTGSGMPPATTGTALAPSEIAAERARSLTALSKSMYGNQATQNEVDALAEPRSLSPPSLAALAKSMYGNQATQNEVDALAEPRSLAALASAQGGKQLTAAEMAAILKRAGGR